MYRDLENDGENSGVQNVPDLGLSNNIPKGLILTDRVKGQRVCIIGPIESDVTEWQL